MNRSTRTAVTGAEAVHKARLEGPDMSGPLTAALRPLGLVPLSFTHVRSHHRPGAGISALYRVQAVPRRSRSAGQPAGAPVCLQIGATTASLTPEQSRNTVRGALGGTDMRLWVHPRDPVLSGLPWATNAAAVARGVFGGETDGGHAVLKLAAYRPLRRAVIRATFQESTVYLKVPQPELAAGLRRRVEVAAAAGLPVPPLLVIAPEENPASESVLALGALPGVSLHRRLSSEPAAGFDPGSLTDLLAGLPAAALEFPGRPSWAERVLDYAAGSAAVLPAYAERIMNCARDADAAVRAADAGPVVPTHGDFHGGNLLAIPGRGGPQLSGLLDLDGLGPGHRVDDLACFLGHLFVCAALNPGVDALRSTAERCAAAFAAETDPAALYSRSGAVALTLVAGAAGRGRLEAEQTLAAAEGLVGRSRSSS